MHIFAVSVNGQHQWINFQLQDQKKHAFKLINFDFIIKSKKCELSGVLLRQFIMHSFILQYKMRFYLYVECFSIAFSMFSWNGFSPAKIIKESVYKQRNRNSQQQQQKQHQQHRLPNPIRFMQRMKTDKIHLWV